MELKNKIDAVNLKFGYKLLVLMLDHFEYKEEYEICQEINNKLDNIEKYFGIEIERFIDKGFIEDYVAEFWKFGLSGDTALSNLPFYIKESIEIISQ